MKETRTIQEIFNLLITGLVVSVDCNVMHTLGVFIEKSPLENFLSMLQLDLLDNFNKDLFTNIYHNAFYTVDIPKNRNHIAVICDGYSDTHHFPKYKIWIDLDKIATILRQHYQMLPTSTLYVTESGKKKLAGTIGNVYRSVDNAVNSNWNPHNRRKLLLLGTILGSMASAVMLALGVGALTSLITMSSTGIVLLFAGSAFSASLATYSFFQQNKKQKFAILHDLDSASTASFEPISIETAFQKNLIEKNKRLEPAEQSFLGLLNLNKNIDARKYQYKK